MCVPWVSSISKRPTATFQMVDLISQLLNLSNQTFLRERRGIMRLVDSDCVLELK